MATLQRNAVASSNPVSTRENAIGLVYIRPRQVAFVRTHGDYASASMRAWNLMLAWLDDRGLAGRSPCGYGLTHDNPAVVVEPLCRYDACVELPSDFVENLDDGIGYQTLPGGAFARLRHCGGFSGVSQAVSEIRDGWLARQHQLTLDRRRPFLFIYGQDPRTTAAAELFCDVCLPVRAPCEDIIPRLRFPIAADSPV